MKNPIEITGVHVNAFKNNIKVSVEYQGKWVEILDEHWACDGHLSHIIEPLGILGCAENTLAVRPAKPFTKKEALAAKGRTTFK